MVNAVTAFPKSFADAVEQRVLADPGIKKQWEDVSNRFRLVFSDPESAFRTIRSDTLVKDPVTVTAVLQRLTDNPQSFGTLRGRTGLLAGAADRGDRQRAEANVPALKRDIEGYLRMRSEAEHKYGVEENAVRQRLSIDIPALSRDARRVLERVRDAIDRNDLRAALEFALADRMAKAEIDGFNRAVAERFGGRSLLTNAAREPNGAVFDKAAAGMNAVQREQLRAAPGRRCVRASNWQRRSEQARH